MRKNSDKIFALATKKSKSAIALFRLSGSTSIKSITKITNKKTIKEKTPTVCYILNKNKEIIDQVIITVFKKPKSYTGEEMAEISCHGSVAIINKINETLIANNFRTAEPGEFTKRALLNDKLTVLEAESINDIVNAETENQRRIAIKNFTGGLEEFVENISTKIMKLLADVEAIIDFVDEELPKDLYKKIKEQKKNIVNLLEKTIEQSLLSKEIFSGYTITLIGKPNTGKSSFINYINNKEISIVTNIPGTTTDLITSILDINGNKYTFIDTAGIRKYRNLIEKIGIEKSLKSATKSDLNIVFLKNKEINSYKSIKNKIFVKSKFDINKIKIKGIHNISSKSGYGVKNLLNKISKKLENNVIEDAIFSRERHVNSLKKALINLKKTNFKEIDISAENIRNSLTSIRGINQKFDIEEILDIIFSDFCIGK